MSLWSQTDPRWASKLLGYNTAKSFNLGNYGCLVTAIANMLTLCGDDTKPDTLNSELRLMHGFLPGGGLLSWPIIPKLNPAIRECGIIRTVGEVNNWTADPANYAIMEVKAGRNQHFVLGNTPNTIIDSQDGHQKNILTYPLVEARLYRWIEPGKGAATVDKGDPIMTAAEEHNAYQIVLNRDPEISLPSGRSGLQFIRGAQAELEAGRAHAAAQLATALSEKTDIQAALTEALIKLDNALKAPPTPEPTIEHPLPTPAPLPPGITDEVVNPAVRISKGIGEMIDYGGDGHPHMVKEGMVFKQWSTFIADGRVQVRTEKSADNNKWYGTDEALFEPLPKIVPELSKADTIHLGASKIYGAWTHLLFKLWHKSK